MSTVGGGQAVAGPFRYGWRFVRQQGPDGVVRAEQVPRQVQLIGYRATPEGYLRVRPDARGWLWLEPVRLWLAGEGERVGCYDEEGNRVPDYPEMEQAVQEALARAEESAVLAE